MKKTIGLFLVLALSCFLFCACTAPQPDGTEPVEDNSLPVPSAASGQASVETKTQTPDETNGQTTVNAAPDDMNNTQSTESMNPASQSASSEPAETAEIDEMETVSEYVVDGGSGVGFGGN